MSFRNAQPEHAQEVQKDPDHPGRFKRTVRAATLAETLPSTPVNWPVEFTSCTTSEQERNDSAAKAASAAKDAVSARPAKSIQGSIAFRDPRLQQVSWQPASKTADACAALDQFAMRHPPTPDQGCQTFAEDCDSESRSQPGQDPDEFALAAESPQSADDLSLSLYATYWTDSSAEPAGISEPDSPVSEVIVDTWDEPQPGDIPESQAQPQSAQPISNDDQLKEHTQDAASVSGLSRGVKRPRSSAEVSEEGDEAADASASRSREGHAPQPPHQATELPRNTELAGAALTCSL